MKYILSLILLVFFPPLNVVAGDLDDLPRSLLDLHGVFEGEGTKTGRDSYVFVKNIYEDGMPSGRYAIFMWRDDERLGHVIEGEFKDENEILLFAKGVNASGDHLETKLPLLGYLRRFNGKKGTELRIVPANGETRIPEIHSYRDFKDDYEYTGHIPDGYYDKHKHNLSFTYGGAAIGILTFESTNRRNGPLIRPGEYVVSSDLVGVYVLRARSSNEYGRDEVTPQIRGYVMTYMKGDDQYIIYGQFSPSGAATLVKQVKRKR